MFCQHDLYLEPFGGAASVLLNKPVSPDEIYADLNKDIVNLMRQIQQNILALCERLRDIKCEESVFREWKSKNCTEEFESAIKTFVLHRMSRGGVGGTFSKSTRKYRDMYEHESSWFSGIDNLFNISKRLENVKIMCSKATDLINEFDSEKSLIYLDPPYLRSLRSTPWSAYTVEMDDSEHEDLLNLCKTCKSKIVISGYQSELYDDMLSDWTKLKKSSFLHSGHVKPGSVKKKAEECVWKNF